ncbi:hypothetical protein OQA88_10575 [Cercophora sp. LCS_1]
MRVPPPEILATWPPANYVDPETRGPALMIVELTVLPLAIIILAMRLYVRGVMLRTTGWDDWLMIAATVFGTGVTICVILASTLFGWDKHVWDLTPKEMISGRQVSLAAQTLFVFATCCAKNSILLSYLRFAPLGSWLRRLSIVTIVLIILTNIAFFTVLFTQCRPVTSYWHISKSQHDCIPEGPPLLANAILTALADFVVWALPLPTFIMARLPKSQRVALIILFSCGLFVVFAGCMRTHWIWVVVEASYDVTWEGFHLWIWTAVEVHLGIICGCVPCLKPLIKSYDSSSRGSSKPVYISGGSKGLQLEVVKAVGVSKGEGKELGNVSTVVSQGRERGHGSRGGSLGKSLGLGTGEGKMMKSGSAVRGDGYLDLESCDSSVNTMEGRAGKGRR